MDKVYGLMSQDNKHYIGIYEKANSDYADWSRKLKTDWREPQEVNEPCKNTN
jgi:hypothetical protein